MYRKLLPYVKRFVFVRQGAFNRYYEGKLLALDPETLQMQSYKKDGTEEEIWTIALDTITEFSIGGRHLAELELKASFAASDELLSEHPCEEPIVQPTLTEAALAEATLVETHIEPSDIQPEQQAFGAHEEPSSSPTDDVET
jgi:hypothetical protein